VTLERVAELVRRAAADTGVVDALRDDPVRLRSLLHLTASDLEALAAPTTRQPRSTHDLATATTDGATLFPPEGSGEAPGAVLSGITASTGTTSLPAPPPPAPPPIPAPAPPPFVPPPPPPAPAPPPEAAPAPTAGPSPPLFPLPPVPSPVAAGPCGCQALALTALLSTVSTTALTAITAIAATSRNSPSRPEGGTDV
jgi:hypothetical protein